MVLLNSITGSPATDALVVILALYLVTGIRSYWRLRHIPGPKLWGWSIFPLFYCHYKGDIYETFGAQNRKYGPLVRIGPNTLLTSDPDLMRKMNAPRSPYSRSDWYLAMQLIPGKDNVLSLIRDKDHDERRRMMAAGYAGKENPALEDEIDGCVRDLVNLVDRKYICDPPKHIVSMDLAEKIQFFTSDIMSKLAFDAKFHDLRDDHDNFEYINEIATIFPNLFCLCTIPKVVYWATKSGLFKMFEPSVNATFGMGKVLAITKEQVGKRFDVEGKPKDTEDMLGSFIRHGLDRDQAEQESVIQLAAGSDTTATGLRATMLCIMSNPRVQTKLWAEIDEALSSGKVPSDPDAIIKDQQARDLPYLQACIKEGLRWHPPIAGMLTKKTPPEGDEISGFFVPGGVGVSYSANAIHHSPALYGPDEWVFRPERWIPTSEGGDEPDAEKIKAMERNNQLIFGHGKYQCLGKDVAFIELNKVIFEMMRRFEMSLVNPTNPWTTTCYGIFLQRDQWVTVRRRGGTSTN